LDFLTFHKNRRLACGTVLNNNAKIKLRNIHGKEIEIANKDTIFLDENGLLIKKRTFP